MNDKERIDRNDVTTRRDLFTLQSIHFPHQFPRATPRKRPSFRPSPGGGTA